MPQSSIAVIVAHPDDEVLAFGGSMARHADQGDRVAVLILATGLTSRTPSAAADPQALSGLRGDARRAADILGADRLEFGEFPDNRMDSVPLLDVVKRVETFLAETAPSTVYTHHAGDLNVDHLVTARAVLTACRPQPGFGVRRILAGEILSSSEWTWPADRFRPTTYVPIEAQLDRKCAALAVYETELRAWPHPRSVQAVRHLARLRGCEVGLPAAEALTVIREIAEP